MTGRHLLRFMKKKLEECPNDTVLKDKKGQTLTLKEVLEQAHPEPKDLTTDFLDCHADRSLFQRFDNFNAKYNPCGVAQLREIFLKTSNEIKGKYFGELTRELFKKNEKTTVHTEYRLSIYGRNLSEWDDLARWWKENNLTSPSNRWIVQLPRVFDFLNKTGVVQNFEQYLNNIFQPLFEVTLDPKSHPELFEFLKDVSSFDSCDDESSFEEAIKNTTPKNWTKGNPCYAYYMYFTYANIYSLNLLRQSKGLETFYFRPHAGESGSRDHLYDCYLVAQSINHGIELHRTSSLQYLYYLDQIGLSVSPLSNNALFLKYSANPFYEFFKRGFNVTLSTDDPLQFHSTEQPLIEEYSCASQIWKLTSVDLSEIAKNSVIQSGFDQSKKREWLGDEYESGINIINKTNIPQIRCLFRKDTYDNEIDMLKFYLN
jgi:AMP deaminase